MEPNKSRSLKSSILLNFLLILVLIYFCILINLLENDDLLRRYFYTFLCSVDLLSLVFFNFSQYSLLVRIKAVVSQVLNRFFKPEPTHKNEKEDTLKTFVE